MMAPDYRLCDQTVTVYRRIAANTIVRTVHPRAFLDFKKVRGVDKTGSHDAMSFLLVIPEDADVAAGDKVLEGEGPAVATDAEWRQFVPAAVAGLCVVRWVDPKRIGGRACHVEAGG